MTAGFLLGCQNTLRQISPEMIHWYGQIKVALIKIFDKSQEEKYQMLFNMDDLADRKLSCLLQEMQNLTLDGDSQLLQALWLSKLPTQVRNVVAPYKHLSLDIQAEHEDTSAYYPTMAPQTKVNALGPNGGRF